MKTSCEAARKRKTSDYLGLESHFMQTPASVSDWLISLQTRKSISLVRLNGNTAGKRNC